MCRVAVLVCLLSVYVHSDVIRTAPRFSQGNDERIIGGRPLDIEEAPYQVSYQDLKYHICGGSIIAKQHVLTAGHCAHRHGVTNMKIGFGDSLLSKLNFSNVVRAASHPKFVDATLEYDVGVLKVADPFPIGANNVRPVALVATGERPPDGEPVMVSGWGRHEIHERARQEQLMAVDLNITNHDVCKKLYEQFKAVTSTMICAGLPSLAPGKGPCFGDSGAGLVSIRSKELVGIVSWGEGCAWPERPAVYTNVADQAVQTFITSRIEI